MVGDDCRVRGAVGAAHRPPARLRGSPGTGERCHFLPLSCEREEAIGAASRERARRGFTESKKPSAQRGLFLVISQHYTRSSLDTGIVGT